jgi:hypothetical protein
MQLALPLLDASDRPVRDLVVKAFVDGDELLRLGVHAVDGDVDVPDVRVAVECIDRLVIGEPHLAEKHPDRLVGLCGRRLLVFPPAQDPMLDRVGTALGGLGEIDHLMDLAVVVDVEEVGEAARRRRAPILRVPPAIYPVTASTGTHMCPVIPGCISQGDTRDEALENIREAIELCLENRVVQGWELPEHVEVTKIAV